MLYVPIFKGKCEIFAYYKYSSKKIPTGREQFTFFNDDDFYCLYGGITSNKNNCVWGFNPINLEFFEFCTKGNMEPQYKNRYGHTGVIYQKKLIFYGGYYRDHTINILSELEIFNLEDKSWFTPLSNNAGLVEKRRNHIAEVIGNHMFIHGGIYENFDGENNIFRVLNSSHILNLNNLKWHDVVIIDKGDPKKKTTNSPHLAYHSSCLVLPSDIKGNTKLNLYKIPEVHKLVLENNSDVYF